MIPWGRPKAKREPVNVPQPEMSERERKYHESNQWGR